MYYYILGRAFVPVSFRNPLGHVVSASVLHSVDRVERAQAIFVTKSHILICRVFGGVAHEPSQLSYLARSPVSNLGSRPLPRADPALACLG